MVRTSDEHRWNVDANRAARSLKSRMQAARIGDRRDIGRRWREGEPGVGPLSTSGHGDAIRRELFDRRSAIAASISELGMPWYESAGIIDELFNIDLDDPAAGDAMVAVYRSHSATVGSSIAGEIQGLAHDLTHRNEPDLP